VDARDAATRTARAIVDLPAGFMTDPATYRRGAELGFDGIDFYFLGRGGALGEVAGDVVAATFVFFEPSLVRTAWERGRSVLAPSEAAVEFSRCASTWAEAHLADTAELKQLVTLAGMVVERAPVAAAPLFAAWRSLPEPEALPALALHRVNLLRELRGALHGGAVLAHGLTPQQAVVVHTPHMAPLYGWPDPQPDPELHRAVWEQAEAATDVAFAPVLEVLSPQERAQLVDALVAVHAARS